MPTIIRDGKYGKAGSKTVLPPCPQCGESRQFFDVLVKNAHKNYPMWEWEGIDMCGERTKYKGFINQRAYNIYLCKCYTCGCTYETDPIRDESSDYNLIF